MRAVLVWFALGALLCLGVSGCGGSSPAPKPYTGPSKSASASASAAPTMPSEAAGSSNEAKIAFVRYYLDVLGYASHTGSVSALASLGANDCESCSGVIARIDAIYDKGGRISGRGYSLSNPRIRPGIGGKTVVEGTLIQYRQVTHYSTTGPSKAFNETVVGAQFLLSRTKDHWRIAQWSRE